MQRLSGCCWRCGMFLDNSPYLRNPRHVLESAHFFLFAYRAFDRNRLPHSRMSNISFGTAFSGALASVVQLFPWEIPTPPRQNDDMCHLINPDLLPLSPSPHSYPPQETSLRRLCPRQHLPTRPLCRKSIPPALEPQPQI